MISEALRAHWSTLAVALAGCLSPSQVDFADPGLGTWVELRLARGRVSYAQTTTTTPTANRTQREGEGTIWVGFAEAPGELGLPQKPSELDPLPSDQEGARLPTERVKVVAGGQVEDGRWRPFDAADALSVVTQFRFKPQMIECQELAQTPIQRVRLEAFAPAGIGNVSVMAALRDGRLLVGLDANRYFTVSGTIARPFPALAQVQAHASFVDDDGVVWLGGTSGRLWRFHPTTGQLDLVTTGTVGIEQIDRLVGSGRGQPVLWAAAREYRPEGEPVMTTALRLVWSDPPRWERRILATDRPSTTNVDVAWVDANRAYFSLEVPALLEVTVEPGGGLSTPRELPLPLRLGPVTAVLVENNQLRIASAEGSAVIHSRPLNEPDRWANPIRAHPIRLLRMTSWLGGIAGAGGGWIDITRSTGVGEDVVACGLRPNEGQDDLNEVVALNPRVLMIGGRLSPSAVPQIYRLDSPAD